MNATETQDEAARSISGGGRIRNLAPYPSENPNPVLRAASDGTVTYSNTAGGCVLDEWGCLVGERLPEHIRQLVLEAYSSGKHTEVEVECGNRTLLICAVSMKGSGFVNLYGLDITQRKRAEEALRQSEESFRLLITGMTGHAIFMLDAEGRILNWNTGAQHIQGYDSAEIIGQHFSYLYAANDVERGDPERQLRRALKDGRFEEESWLVHKDGSRFLADVVITALHDESGQLRGFAIVTRDITDRKEAQDKECQWREQLAHALRFNTMGEMTAGIAHELNQPLSTIINYAETCRLAVQKETADKAKLLDNLEEISGQAERAGNIIRRLRDFVRKQEPRRSSVDVNKTVSEVVSFVESEARLADVQIRLPLTADLPHVPADPVQIQQVILNLVRNAFEAMTEAKDGERVLTIKTSSAADGGVEVTVSDTGRSVPAETMYRLFEPFHTTKSNGLGLGLTISQSIIVAHGGRLTAALNPDRGMTFRFTLPVHEGGQGDVV